MATQRLVRLSKANPRRNLPTEVRSKCGESRFASAFRAAFVQTANQPGAGGIEFELSGFGIADFIWMTRNRNVREAELGPFDEPGRAFPRDSARITAFEVKLKDWRRGLSQAYRYGYFANRTIVVLPPSTADVARLQLHVFQDLGIGLWSFDKQSARIQKFHTPKNSKPKCRSARRRALELLGQQLDLC